MARRAGLGRGLSALIPERGSEEPRDERIPVTEVPIGRIAANPQQPRMQFDEESLSELAGSIREHGVIQPLLVSEQEGEDGKPTYQLIAGERRWRAAREAGLETVPVTIRQTTPQELLELAIIENVQRADLNPLEEALAYQRLVNEFGLTQREVAERVGRSRTAVTNTLRLVDLPGRMRESLAAGEITEGHARALLGLTNEHARIAAWERVVREGLNVRQTERMVRAWRDTGAAPPSEAGPPAAPDASAVEPSWLPGLDKKLQQSLGTKVALKRGNGGRGTVTIHFYSDEELGGIVERMLGGETL
ncbi:MAG: ParB/RepB/Spo0J family partition protein [Dehalococcoidia bacterium]|nr:ParB/RepB/Spo0J family partition protein [Dehalococcoidia bacterium]